MTLFPATANNFESSQGINDVGQLTGLAIQFGEDVSPNTGPAGYTFMTGSQGTTTVGPTICAGLTVDANFCGRQVPFSAALTGSWNLTFTNGTDSATGTTPAIGAVSAPLFANSVTISGSGTTPTLSFQLPTNFDDTPNPNGNFLPDAVRVQIFDDLHTPIAQGGGTLPNNTQNVIFTTAVPVTGSTGSFSIPVNLGNNVSLQDGHPYALNVQLIETRGHVPFNNTNAEILKRSTAFFNFTPLPPGSPPSVFLPSVSGPNPLPGFGPVYHFSIGSVSPNQITFIDPAVAIGYDYQTGAGDPNFASVLLPAIQSTPFDLSFLFNGQHFDDQLAGGLQFFFPNGGIDAFSVTGIDPADGLDPNNTTAFITGLTFVAPGQFTGTMTPIVAQVPEPATLLLFGTGLAGLLFRRRRKVT